MPEFNWREVKYEEQKLALMFPAKPTGMTRTIDLNGPKLPMTMHGVKINGLTYTVAWVKLPDPSPQTQSKLLQAMQNGMAKNLQVSAPIIEASTLQISDASGKSIAKIPANSMKVQGKNMQGSVATALQLQALFATHQGFAYQWVVVGPPAEFDQVREQHKLFFESIRFAQ